MDHDNDLFGSGQPQDHVQDTILGKETEQSTLSQSILNRSVFDQDDGKQEAGADPDPVRTDYGAQGYGGGFACENADQAATGQQDAYGSAGGQTNGNVNGYGWNNTYQENAQGQNACQENAQGDNAYRQNAFGQNTYQQSAYGPNTYQQNAQGQNAYQHNTQGQNTYRQSSYGQNTNQQNTQGQNAYQQNTYGRNPYEQNAAQNNYQDPYSQYGYRNPYQPTPQEVYRPEMEEPVSIPDWVGTILLAFIPCAGLIVYIVWAFSGSTKKTKANFCKAVLILHLAVFALSFLVTIINNAYWWY